MQSVRAVVGRHVKGLDKIAVVFPSPNVNINIGSFSQIRGRVELFICGDHRIDRFTTFPFGHIYNDVFDKFNGEGHPSTNGDITIGNDVLICENTTLFSGVTIGDGAIINPDAVVTKDVPPYSIVQGNPARVVERRFADDVIEALLRIQWWNWDDYKIKANLHLLQSADAEALKVLV